MKTRLTLTVKQTVIERARRYSRRTGKSISQLFEEIFEHAEKRAVKTEPQLAAERLLKSLRSSKSIMAQSGSDKDLVKKYVARKFT